MQPQQILLWAGHQAKGELQLITAQLLIQELDYICVS